MLATSPASRYGTLNLEYPASLGLPDGDFHTHLLYAVVTNVPHVGVRLWHSDLLKSDPNYKARYDAAVLGIRLEKVRSKKRKRLKQR